MWITRLLLGVTIRRYLNYTGTFVKLAALKAYPQAVTIIFKYSGSAYENLKNLPLNHNMIASEGNKYLKWQILTDYAFCSASIHFEHLLWNILTCVEVSNILIPTPNRWTNLIFSIGKFGILWFSYATGIFYSAQAHR